MNNIYIVPTPIGNIDDISKRSIEVLRSVEVVYCEDTRHTKNLLSKYKIEAKLKSLHKFNETEKVSSLFKDLETGSVAIVSDAGTPTISDPGQIIVQKAKAKGIRVIPLPGPNAVTTMLSASGLSFKSFTFVGFLEKKESKIVSEINKHKSDVIIFYESSKRINKTLRVIYENFGDIETVIARELTKIHEEILKDKISNLMNREYRGEIVVAIKPEQKENRNELKKIIELLKEEGLPDRTISNVITKTTSFKKNDVYEYLKRLK